MYTDCVTLKYLYPLQYMQTDHFNPDLVSVVGFKALKTSKAPCLQDKNLLTVYR